MNKQKKWIRRGLLFFSLLFMANSTQAAYQCQQGLLEKTGMAISKSQAKKMLSDAEFSGNKKLSRREKIRKVKEHIKYSHKGLPDISNDDLAELIIDISDCMGHDFSIFAGLLRKESDYCLNKLNTSSRKSTASGCGQITIWPIKEFKNQFELPGHTKSGDPDAKQALGALLSRCFKDNEEEVTDFLKLMSESPNDVKAYLRNSGDYKMDLITSALYLKLLYGRTGFYYNAKSKSAGALSLYGEGSRYASAIESFAGRVQKSVELCYDDTEYIKSIEQASCELSEDPASCSLTTPTWDI